MKVICRNMKLNCELGVEQLTRLYFEIISDQVIKILVTGNRRPYWWESHKCVLVCDSVTPIRLQH